MTLGFIGLGQMGKPIALNLLKAGGAMIVADRTDRHFADFRARGSRATTDLPDVARANIVFLCLPNTTVVESVLLGADGLLSQLDDSKPHDGKTVVDLSTIAYSRTGKIARALEDRGIAFLDAPISGMEARAKDAALTIMCGGPRDVFDRVKPYLDLIGNKVLLMGPTGSGQLTKLINQLLFDINAAALSEVLPMAVKLGLDPDLVGDVVNSGTGRSYASEFFIPRMLKNHFTDGYPMQAAYKDLISGAGLSAELGIPMPVLAAATATYQTALLRGLGGQDKGAMIRVFEDLLGVAFRNRSGLDESSPAVA